MNWLRWTNLPFNSYNRALTCSPAPGETHTIRLNRCLALLRTRQYDGALADAECVTTTTTATGKPVEKALYRRAEALYNLQQYRECCEILKQLRIEYPDNKAAKDQLTRAISRLSEHTYGKFQFKQLHAEAAKLRPPCLDHATYIGPVSVQAAGSRGRGLFTTRAVSAGDLLFCEKAFAYAFVDEDKIRGEIRITMDPGNGVTVGSQADLIDTIIQKLHKNPSLMPTVTAFHHGSYQPADVTEVDGTPVIDS